LSDQTDYSGIAALTICEALLLAMNDHKLLQENEIVGVLQDAAAAHENAVLPESGMATHEINMHHAVAALINKIIVGGNSVRRP
jgi:hypothetical protein